MPRSVPASICDLALVETPKNSCVVPADRRHGAGVHVAIGHVHDIDAGDLVEELAGQMRHRADAGRGAVELARIGLGVIDQFLDRMHRHVGIDHQRVRDQPDDGDRLELLQQIVGRGLHRGVERVGRRREQHGGAVRRRGRHRLHGELTAGARPRLDHDRLAPDLLQVLADDPRKDVGARPDQDFHRMVRIRLRLRQGGGAKRQRQNQRDRANQTLHRLLTRSDLSQTLFVSAAGRHDRCSMRDDNAGARHG